MKRYLTIPAVLVALTACTLPAPSSNDDMPVVPALDTDAAIQIAAMDYAWPDARAGICPTLREMTLTPIIERELIDAYEDGYGEPLTSAARAHLGRLMREC